MSCLCGSKPKDDEKEEDPISSERSCTDLLFLLFFIGFWAGMVVIGAYAFANGADARPPATPDQPPLSVAGNFNVVKFGLDSTGYLCGDRNPTFHSTLLPPPPPPSPSPPPLPPPPPPSPSPPPRPSPPPPPPSPPGAGRRLQSATAVSALNPLGLGSGPDLRAAPYVLYYNPTQWSPAAAVTGLSSVCVASCPTTSVLDGSANSSLSSWPTTCRYFSQSSFALNSAYSSVDPWSTSYFATLNVVDKGWALMNGDCYATLLPTRPYLNRCIPTIPDYVLQALNGNASSASANATAAALKQYLPAGLSTAGLVNMHNVVSTSLNTVAQYVNDLAKGWLILFIGGFIAAAVGALLWMVLLRYFAGTMLWITVLLVNAFMVGVTLFSAAKGGLIGSRPVGGIDFGALSSSALSLTTVNDYQTKNFKILTYILAAATGLVLLLTLLMIPRLRVAAACIKVASQAVGQMPMILFFPLLPLSLYCMLIIWWVFVAVFLYACGTATQDPVTGAWGLTYTRKLQYVGIYHLFGLLWGAEFLVAFGHTVVAGAIATYYWKRNEWASGQESPEHSSPITQSLRRTVRYHLGSVAAGSFVVAVVQFIRLVLEYINRKTKQAQEHNQALKFLMCCFRCCAWYTEQVVTFVNRNAYIMIAVKGTGYCPSAMRAVALIVQNALRLAAVNTFGDVLLWLGKVAVTSLGFLVAFAVGESSFYTDPTSQYYLSSPILPILVALLIAHGIANMFFSVYEMAIDTIMLSFCDDCDRHNGHARFAPPLLQEALGDKYSTPAVGAAGEKDEHH